MSEGLLSTGTMATALAAFAVVCVIIAYYARDSATTMAGFSLGGWTLGPVVMAFAFFATRLSASAFIGEPGFTYQYGWPYHWIGVFNAAFWAAAILLLTRRISAYSYSLQALTVPEFLGRRYQSNLLRVWVSLASVVFYVLIMVAQYKGIAALLNTLGGFPAGPTLIAFSVLVVLYVYTGGFKAVAYTDVFQGGLMVIMAVALWGVSFAAVGGSFARVNETLRSIDPQMVAISQEAGLFSTLGVICLPIYLFISLATNPYVAVRLMALGKTDRKSFLTFGVVTITLGLVTFLMYNVGLFARVLFPNLSDPDTAVPMVAGTLLPAWAAGLFLLGLFAAILSTVDSLLHTCSTTLARDVYQNVIRPNASDQEVTRVSRVMVAVVTLAVLVISLYQLPPLLALLSLMAAGGSGLLTLGPLLIGLYWDRATAAGAVASSLMGVAAFAFFNWVVPINVWERGVLAGLLAIGTLVLVSYLTKPVSPQILAAMKGHQVAGTSGQGAAAAGS